MASGNPIVLDVSNLTKTYRSAGEEISVLPGTEPGCRRAGGAVRDPAAARSTLLHLIAGLDAADGGEITLANTVVSAFSVWPRQAARQSWSLFAVQPDPEPQCPG
jgi:putative ABC transport system ATP-binding protein